MPNELMSPCPLIQVIHPGVRGQVKVDLLLMHVASRLLSLLPGLRWLSLPEVVQEFEKLMTKQVSSILCSQVILDIRF